MTTITRRTRRRNRAAAALSGRSASLAHEVLGSTYSSVQTADMK